MYSRALLIIAGLLLTCCVNAQTIYKCPQADGTYAYTDVKCTGPHAVVIEQAESDLGSLIPAVTPAQLSRMTLREIYDRMQALSARRRQALTEVLRERKATSARLGTHVHEALPDPEAGMDGKTWESKLLVAQTELVQVVDELRRRCPGGSAMNATFQGCRK